MELGLMAREQVRGGWRRIGGKGRVEMRGEVRGREGSRRVEKGQEGSRRGEKGREGSRRVEKECAHTPVTYPEAHTW